jgi:NADH-quinone oxidoreductase subunit J
MTVAIAGLYLALNAAFLAVAQLIVYAGAVVVLFLFVIMLLGPDATGTGSDTKGLVPRAFAGGAFALTALASVALGLRVASELDLNPVDTSFGTPAALGQELFTRALAPFELSTGLLMVAILGAVAVGKGAVQARQGLGRRSTPRAEVTQAAAESRA